MLIRPTLINLNLLLAAVLAMLAGCSTMGIDNKEHAVLRLHMEAGPDGSGQSGTVPVYRARPIMVSVQSIPFLTEAYLTSASVVEVSGGFAMQFNFDKSGANLLEQYTGLNRGKHYAIFCQFGRKPNVESRWLAAPLINRVNQSGSIVFTPDCSREEANRISIGLSNTVAQIKRQSLIK